MNIAALYSVIPANAVIQWLPKNAYFWGNELLDLGFGNCSCVAQPPASM